MSVMRTFIESMSTTMPMTVATEVMSVVMDWSML